MINSRRILSGHSCRISFVACADVGSPKSEIKHQRRARSGLERGQDGVQAGIQPQGRDTCHGSQGRDRHQLRVQTGWCQKQHQYAHRQQSRAVPQPERLPRLRQGREQLPARRR